jgi:hypothetical protein
MTRSSVWRPVADVIEEHEELYGSFHEAEIESVLVGPRREVVLTVRALVYGGHEGRYGVIPQELVEIRFGKIENFSVVAKQFRAIPESHSEIDYLDLDPDAADSKGGPWSFKFIAVKPGFEPYQFKFRCGNVTLTRVQEPDI